ncbi:MAG: hypothetical protein KJO55_04610, partial [Gammaproteobacteria bacterium]|nr:hypothetical protein [Gammaproteobacteria bacterium]
MIRYWLFSLLLALPVAHASALLENTGHQRLAAKLGADLPDGKGVIILQVEASTRATHKGVVPAGEHRTWIPDVAARGLDGQPIELLHPPLIEGTSGHATAVARFLVGTRGTGMATGVERLDVIDLRRWLGFGYLRTGSVLPPATPGAHLLNHSWAARLDTKNRRGIDADILRRIDWLADREEVLSVAGIRNTAQQLNQPLLASARNALIVGKSDGEHSHGTAELNHPDYPAGRNRPHLVVPVATSSGATPVVTSAAALLL